MLLANNRPGTMLYFDLLYDLDDYTDEESGQLLKAMLRYGLSGEVPQFSDRGMRTMWRKLQSTIDRDGDNYDHKILQRRYAAYCKKAKSREEEPVSFDEWLSDNEPTTVDNDRTTTDNDHRTVVDSRYPTSTTTSSSTTKSTSNPTSTSISSTITPPTLEEVIAYAKTKFIPEDFATRFLEYYDAGNWIDSEGKPVRSWQQKLAMWWGKEMEKIKKEYKKEEEKKKTDRNRIRTDEEYLADKDFFGDD